MVDAVWYEGQNGIHCSESLTHRDESLLRGKIVLAMAIAAT